MKKNAKERIKKGLQRNTTIQIEVDSSGSIYYTDEHGLPAYYHGVKMPRPGEKVYIMWWTEDDTAELTITFTNGSPCTSAQFKSKGGFVKALVRADAARGPYDYDVVYSVRGKVRKDDPQIIIN
jgi:hypothetical protein